jgi:8-amino-7-oxononanoate synthase
MNVKEYSKKRTKNTERSSQTLNTKFSLDLKELKAYSLLRKLTGIDSPQGATVIIKGRNYLNFSSNDYLNLSGNAAIINAAIRSIRKYGAGSGASRLLSGTLTPHEMLEKRVAQFKKSQAALVFNTGYAANTGIIPVISGSDSIIFSDELNHASIVDGTRLAKAEVEIYMHKDMNHLDALLKKSLWGAVNKRRIVVTDTVFSMDGDIAPLKEINKLCTKYDATLMIDDAHGTGVLGKTGRGALEHCGVSGKDSIQMGTFSKAAGSFGAFVAGSDDLINILINRSRSFIYSTALPPAIASTNIEAIDIIEKRSMQRRRRLWKNREQLYQGLKELGFNTLHSETPIIPVFTGDVRETNRLSKYLFNHSIYAPAIRPPTVPDGQCRIRFTVTAGHSNDDIDLLLNVLKQYKRK